MLWCDIDHEMNKYLCVMKHFVLCILLSFLYSNNSFSKIQPEEIVETFHKNPELFNVLAQMSYHYMAQKNASEDDEESMLRSALAKISPTTIPGTVITQKKHPEAEKSIIAFVSPYCPHCRVLAKNLIQLEKEGFFPSHVAVSVSYAPTNLASECATKAMVAAHKLGGNEAVAKAIDLLEKRINPVEHSDWPKVLSQHHNLIKEDELRTQMDSQEVAKISKDCEECVTGIGMNSFPVIAVYSKRANASKAQTSEDSVVDVILGNPSHINLLKETLLKKLR